MKERLEEIIEARREERLSQAEQLRHLLPLREELKRGATQEAEGLGLSATGFAFYQLLDKHGLDRGADLAGEIESVLGQLVVIDWTRKDDVQREMRKQLRRILLREGLTRENAEPIITDVMSTAKARLSS